MLLNQYMKRIKNKAPEAATSQGYHPPPLWQDPRPDLEGRADWERLLKLAYEMCGEDVAGVLNGVRSGGAVLVRGGRGFRIEPVIDAERGWWPPELYAEVRERYMLPIRDEIARCLEALASFKERESQTSKKEA